MRTILVLAGSILIGIAPLLAQQPGKTSAKRARVPTFDPAKTTEYFFDDVFSKLIGPRPATASAAEGNAAGSSRGTAGSPSIPPKGGSSNSQWSKLISATTLENEVKTIKQEVDKSITNPTDFASRGHKVIRREFSILAMLFKIISEYDGDVRFKKDAPTAQVLFARAANNAKAGGSVNVFNEAKLRKSDLQDLVNGSPLATPGTDSATGWGGVLARAPLMQRLELIFQSRLSPALANAASFTKDSDHVLHQAEMIAVMASVLTQKEMDDADDEMYVGHALAMRSAAAEIVDAVRLKNYDQARTAAGKIDKACSQCHESFR